MSKSLVTILKSLLPIVVICSLCLIAIAPLLRADVPCTHDGGLHYYRVVAMRQALKDGILFTRYLPDLAFGYGFPFFNYRAPVSYYLTLAFFLIGIALPTALKLVYVVSIVGSAVTAYLFARDLFGTRAGLVAAVAYAYAPYQFLNALTRGNAPESLALALLPLILWAFRRLALSGRRSWFLVSVGSLAALTLTHNISSLIFTPLLVAYLFVLWLVYRRDGHWIAAGGALALALGLTVFFWAPAILEKGYVQLHASHSNRNNDFHYNFLGLGEILAPPEAVDTSLLNPPMLIHLGLAPAILAAIGFAVGILPSTSSGQGRRPDRERKAALAFFALAAIVMVWMSTGASLWLWENLPLVPFVQFPWRFIGRAALPIAILASAAFADQSAHESDSPLAACLLPLASCLLLILAAFPATYPLRGTCQGDPAYPTIEDLFAYERRPGGLVGADPTGSYFPVGVKQKPKGSPLEAQYAAGETVARFDETPLPEGASIVEADYGPNRARVVVETPAAFRARYLAFYFPGWRATVDGQPAAITPTDPEGLISFDVPAGRHTVTVRFGETPLRLACDIISILSLVTLLVITPRYPRISNLQSPSSHPRIHQHLLFIVHCSLFIVALLLFAFKLAIVDCADTIFRRPGLQPDATLPGVQHPMNLRYADGMLLIGYDQDRETLPADGALRIDLYLSAYAQPGARYQTVIHLVGPDGLRWSRQDTFRPRGYASYPYTTIWSPGIYGLDSHEIEPLPGTPPGTYDVVLTVFDRDTLAPLSMLNDQGQPAAPELTLGQVTLARPRRPAELPEDGRLDLQSGDLTLLLADFNTGQAAAGDPVFLTTLWQAEEQPAEDVAFRLTLVSASGSPAAEYALSPTGAWYPTTSWRAGDVWRGQHIFHLPANLDSGDYSWQISLPTDYQSTNLPSTIHVTAPPHTFTPPTLPHALDTTLGEIATLVGFDLAGEMRSGNTLTVTLVWRAEETPTASYRAFVHLLDAEGKLVAQSDGVPAGWARPTTGWLPGEFIVDPHALTIPQDAAGEYTLAAGLYIPGGARLATSGGSDAVPLITLALNGR
ncbi:MAG: glycosyltransferase family 39 protein [Anaerolineae bacterium]|nr:glycosyltransferase family 39 protein [Anaerolineae bacterium]